MENEPLRAAVDLWQLYFETGRWRGDSLADRMTGSGRDRLFPKLTDSCRWSTQAITRKTAVGLGRELTVAASSGHPRLDGRAATGDWFQGIAGVAEVHVLLLKLLISASTADHLAALHLTTPNVHFVANPLFATYEYSNNRVRARQSAHVRGRTMKWAARSCTVVSLVLVLMLPPSAAEAAGIQALKVPSDGPLPGISGAVWYPCAFAPTAVVLGPFQISAAKDCPVNGTKLPLVVISHGRTGSFLGHRDTAQVLADAGFVVAAISHPGDNAQDGSRSNDLSVFVERPADIKRLIDYLLGAWSHASAIDPSRIGVFGFSRGGYTGLVVVGAKPRFGPRIGMCVGQTNTICEDVRQGRLEPLVHDDRVKAAVIADPLSIFFTKTSFEEVRVPIQLWRSEGGGDGVTPASVAAVAEHLPVKPDFRTVPNAQHFSFVPPCPGELALLAPEICKDSSDFDREAFHKEFNAEVVDFFRRELH